MLKNYKQGEWKTVVEYELVFDDGHNNGFGFLCDREGTLLESEEQNPAAYGNYQNCLKHPEQFVRFNEIVRYERKYREPGHGTCICGAEVELNNQYYGACQCPECGRWYNLYGQSLLSPEQWERDPSEEEYW